VPSDQVFENSLDDIRLFYKGNDLHGAGTLREYQGIDFSLAFKSQGMDIRLCLLRGGTTPPDLNIHNIQEKDI